MDENEYENGEGTEVLHAVFGTQQATIMATALGMLLTTLNDDIQRYDGAADSLMGMMSIKMCAEDMFTSLWSMLGCSEEQVLVLLSATEAVE